jgi:ferredoxin
MIDDSCIGCGLCEYICPVEGEAAIRVGIQFPGEHEEEEGSQSG